MRNWRKCKVLFGIMLFVMVDLLEIFLRLSILDTVLLIFMLVLVTWRNW